LLKVKLVKCRFPTPAALQMVPCIFTQPSQVHRNTYLSRHPVKHDYDSKCNNFSTRCGHKTNYGAIAMMFIRPFACLSVRPYARLSVWDGRAL